MQFDKNKLLRFMRNQPLKHGTIENTKRRTVTPIFPRIVIPKIQCFRGKKQFYRSFLFSKEQIISIATLCFLMAGCAHVKKAGKQDPEYIWNKAWSSFKTDVRPFSAQGKITYDSPKLTQSLNFVWRQEGPRHIRIDISGFFGIGLASACISDDEAWLNVPLKSLYVNGTISGIDSMAEKAAGIGIQRLLEVMQGRPPLETGQYSVAQDADKYYLFVFTKKDSTIAYRLDQHNARIVGYQLDIKGKPEYSIGYNDWKPFNNSFRPHTVELFSHGEQTGLTIKFSSMSAEQAFTNDIWKQPMPGRVSGDE
jgi:outer membrane biogenesis lipoprotein LolB